MIYMNGLRHYKSTDKRLCTNTARTCTHSCEEQHGNLTGSEKSTNLQNYKRQNLQEQDSG
jgi:hypothetical protein